MKKDDRRLRLGLLGCGPISHAAHLDASDGGGAAPVRRDPPSGAATMTLTGCQPTRATASCEAECPQLESFLIASTIVPVLQAQVEAIWPQEKELLARYRLPAAPAVLDVGCGTGEFEVKLAGLWPQATLVGLDIAPTLLSIARKRTAGLGNVTFRCASGSRLEEADATLDVVFCRHVLQARSRGGGRGEGGGAGRPGGALPGVPGDSALFSVRANGPDTNRLWREGWIEAGRRSGIDLCIGRKAPALLRRLGLREVQAHFAVIDSLRVDRQVLRRLFGLWRGVAKGGGGQDSSLSPPEVIPPSSPLPAPHPRPPPDR